MSPDEKFTYRLERWASAEGRTFSTPEAAERYQRRAQRIKDIIVLKKPDRVPCLTPAGGVIAEYAGYSAGDMFYDYEKAFQASVKFHEDFAPDYQSGGHFLPGKSFDILEYQVYRWPGGTLPMETAFQCVESEYMTADEYDELIDNPESFYMRTYMPRVFGALAGWNALPTFYTSTELPFLPTMLTPMGNPEVVRAFKAFIEAGEAAVEWAGARARIGKYMVSELGLPTTSGGYSKAPFDIIGDTLRGTRGIMLDMFRRPDKLLAALEKMVPIAVEMAVYNADRTGCPIIMIPLHKGADSFMSRISFSTFYWPSFKASLLGMIDEGLVPAPFVEGSYDQRLDIIAESGLPPGKTFWRFDQSDMTAVKDKFHGWACYGGNIPSSMFHAGTPEQMEAYTRNLIENIGQDGSFFLAPGAGIDNARPENLHAYIDTARKYGTN